jgi:hypothetical protein
MKVFNRQRPWNNLGGSSPYADATQAYLEPFIAQKCLRPLKLANSVPQKIAGVTFMQRNRNWCSHIESSWLTTAYQLPKDPIVDGDGKMTFTETIAMVRTDHGGQAVR